eukprot:SAG22_NODE_1346_length_4674_cov_2.003934_2_plen_59_part_00
MARIHFRAVAPVELGSLVLFDGWQRLPLLGSSGRRTNSRGTRCVDIFYCVSVTIAIVN